MKSGPKFYNLEMVKKMSMADDNRSEGDHLMQIVPETNDIGENLSEDDAPANLSQGDSELEWQRVRPRRRRHIELRDLSEQNFLDLIEMKNQDKRFFGWLNFKPLFDDVKEETMMDMGNGHGKTRKAQGKGV